ncbi:hypothetical protein FGB62_40g150 [Gracilaria domingensis]|nr:hypothetical protein FGB62_40g150 [Gracilaria domingensis]
MLRTFHEWLESRRCQDLPTLSLETLVQELCALSKSQGGNSTVPIKIAELALPQLSKPSETLTNLHTELGAVFDLFRSLIQAYGMREDALSKLVKDLLGSRTGLESLVSEPLGLVQPMLVHIERTKGRVKDELKALHSERETVSKKLTAWRKQLDEVRLSNQLLLSKKEEEIARIRAQQTTEKEQIDRFERRVKELESEVQKQVKLKEELSKTSHDLEVCRTVLTETRKDFAKSRADTECLRISIEQKDLEIGQLKSTLQLQEKRMLTKDSGHVPSASALRHREDECAEARQKEVGNTSVVKPAYSSRRKLHRRKNEHGDKQISTVPNRAIGRKSVRFPNAVDSDMGDGLVDGEDLFEDQETTTGALTEREVTECGERSRHSVRIPPRSEKKNKNSNIALEHCGIGRKRQNPKSGVEALKSKRFRNKHM